LGQAQRARANKDFGTVHAVLAPDQIERELSRQRSIATDIEWAQSPGPGKRIVTDGPFVETREQLGGYFLIDASDIDEATSIAAQILTAKWGTVEVRPVMDVPTKGKA
jgi:hypothetical protein